MPRNIFHTLYFEATRKCNLSCPFCSSGSNKKELKDKRELDFDFIVKNIFLPAKEIGTEFIAFSGGEFLLRDDAFELVEMANKLGFGVAIATNGTTLTEQTLFKLKSILKDNLLISLGINSFDEINKKTRCKEISFTLEILNRLEKHKIRCNIAVTMGAFNASVFPQTLDKIRELSLPFNRIPFVPRNSPCKELMFDKNLMKNILHPSLNKTFHGYVSFTPFFLTEEDYIKITGEEIVTNVPTNPSVGCWCGSFYAITPVGDVTPCPLLGDNISGGNLYEIPLSRILFESELFKKIIDRKKFKGKCGNCKYNFTCGGCRAMAYYHTGDVFNEDPTCFIDELSEKELIEKEKQTARNFKYYCKMAKLGNSFKNIIN